MTFPARRVTRYGRFAAAYDALAAAWSGPAIRRARRATVQGLRRGDRVLVLGAGTGDAAVSAALSGAAVTAVDVSRSMIVRVRRRAARAGVRLETRVCDVRSGTALDGGPWDRISAPFLLSCLDAGEVSEVLVRLEAVLGPSGRLVVADFVPMSDGRLTRLAYRLYYGGPSLLFGALARNPVQPPHDLSAFAAAAGFVAERRRRFGVFGIGPRWFEAVTYVRSRDARAGGKPR